MSKITFGEKYDAVQLNYQGEEGTELMEKLSPEKDSFVLDLGCGTGYLASVLAKRVGPNGKVYGVDPNGGRIKVAQRNYASMENLQFFNGSSENLPGGPYDAVFSNHAMHWIKDKKTAFQNVFDNLNVNGKFAINCAAGYISKNWKLLMNPGVLNQMHLCTSDELKKIAVHIGFEVEFESVDTVTQTFESIEKFADWILSTDEIAADTIDPVKMEKFKKQCETEPQYQYIRIMIYSVSKGAMSNNIIYHDINYT